MKRSGNLYKNPRSPSCDNDEDVADRTMHVLNQNTLKEGRIEKEEIERKDENYS